MLNDHDNKQQLANAPDMQSQCSHELASRCMQYMQHLHMHYLTCSGCSWKLRALDAYVWLLFHTYNIYLMHSCTYIECIRFRGGAPERPVSYLSAHSSHCHMACISVPGLPNWGKIEKREIIATKCIYVALLALPETCKAVHLS